MMRFLVFLTLLVPSVAFSQYPNKAIRMIVPFAPGGASDFVGQPGDRAVQRLSRAA